MFSQKLTKEMNDRVERVAEGDVQRFILVDTSQQELTILEGGKEIVRYPVSTSSYGIGSEEHSNKTPLGVHRVCARVGDGAPPGRIFKNREDTGEDWDGAPGQVNLILSRILRLEGLEPGINKGPGIDTFERYIYIHGTDKEESVGTPISHGCIVMRNTDIVSLFDQVEEGAIVVIT